MATVQVLATLLLSVGLALGSISCRDPNGNEVDWYYVYKLPKLSSSNPLIEQGLGHYYLDVTNPTFRLSDVSLEDKGQAIAQTLMPIYSQGDKVAYVMYNDEWPDGKKVEYRGHTKGVVAFDGDTGYWLIHSVPQFPDNSSYDWPESAVKNGQSMLCVTFKTSSMETIGILKDNWPESAVKNGQSMLRVSFKTSSMETIRQMKYNYPSVYASNLPSELLQMAPSFEDLVEGRHVSSPPWMSKTLLYSAQGQQFNLYVKFTKFNQDLYADFVAPDMATDMRTETWRNGAHALPSNCSGDYHVLNIRNINFPDVGFSSTKDHSKMAITDKSVGAVCVGDINRMEGQFQRGGGTMCAQIPAVYEQYNGIVSDLETC